MLTDYPLGSGGVGFGEGAWRVSRLAPFYCASVLPLWRVGDRVPARCICMERDQKRAPEHIIKSTCCCAENHRATRVRVRYLCTVRAVISGWLVGEVGEVPWRPGPWKSPRG